MNAPRGDRSKQWLAVALVLAGAVVGLRLMFSGPGDAVGLLLMVPVALAAVEFGWWGGLGAGVLGAALNVWTVLLVGAPLSAVGVVNRTVAFVVVGGVIGRVVAMRSGAERESSHWLEMSHDMLGIASLDGYFTNVNPSWERCLGYSAAELKERPYLELIHPDDLAATTAAAGSLADGATELVDFENRYRSKDGGWRWILWSASSDGKQIYVVGKDITDRKLAERQRAQLLSEEQILARTDRVTGLPNRLAWDEQLEIHMARAGGGPYALGILLLDLDDFKRWNDLHGHQAGDDQLNRAGSNWRKAIRDRDFLARIGGDEFAVLIPNVSPEQAGQLMDRLVAATPQGQGCSIGLAYWDGDETSSELIARADRALYANKSRPPHVPRDGGITEVTGAGRATRWQRLRHDS
jgi:diguanylate cyclase (GGDEF)-like protein/PAS domain S-box-containing protein